MELQCQLLCPESRLRRKQPSPLGETQSLGQGPSQALGVESREEKAQSPMWGGEAAGPQAAEASPLPRGRARAHQGTGPGEPSQGRAKARAIAAAQPGETAAQELG